MTLADARPPEPRTTGRGLVLAHDRSREYRRARGRTLFVRTLRVLLPLSTASLLGLYAFSILEGAGLSSGVPEAAIRQILPEDLAMNNPRYEGFGKDGSSYVFTAKTAQQDLLKPAIVKLNAITGTIYQADKTKTDVFAARGVFDNDASLLELFDEINVASEGGLKAKLTRATLLTKESILTSPSPVTVEFPNGAIRANTMTLRQKAKEVTFVENVSATFTPPDDTSKPPGAVATSNETQSPGLFEPSSGPVEITSTRLDVSDTTKTALFTGNVVAVQGESSLTTPELEVTYDGAGMISGSPPPKGAPQPSATSGTGSLRRIVARSSVVLKRSESEVVTSDSAEFDTTTETATLLGNVIMTSGQSGRATSDRLDLDQRAGTALLIGNVVVTQDENELKGRRLLIDNKTGRAELTSPPGLGAGPGRINARLAQAGGKKDGKAPKPAQRSQPGTDPGAFQTDPAAPVEIEADQLEIDDKAKVAIFRGDVSTVQGSFSLASAELYAYYTGEAGLATTGAPPQDGKQQETQLSRIEARRNVKVTSSDGRTATGDKAEFDAKKNTVVMTGNVILAQGQNMVRGTRLVIDMANGETKIDTAPAKTIAAPAGGGWSTEATEGETAEGSGRASAVFFPQQLKAGQAKKATPGAKAGGPGIGDGWNATANPEASKTESTSAEDESRP